METLQPLLGAKRRRHLSGSIIGPIYISQQPSRTPFPPPHRYITKLSWFNRFCIGVLCCCRDF